MWLGTAWPVLQKLPDVFNALLDHHGLLSQIARRAQTSDPSKGAAMTLATLNGHYDPRLDAELFDAIDGIGETPEAILISNAPLAPEIEVTAERYLMFTLYFASSSSHLPRIASRLPAANVMGLRNGSIPGSAITCLPF